MTEQQCTMSAQEALDYLVERLQTQYAIYQFDGVLPRAIPILTAALDEREALVKVLEPFANHTVFNDNRMAGKADHPVIVRLSYLRQARAAFAQAKEGQA